MRSSGLKAMIDPPPTRSTAWIVRLLPFVTIRAPCDRVSVWTAIVNDILAPMGPTVKVLPSSTSEPFAESAFRTAFASAPWETGVTRRCGRLSGKTLSSWLNVTASGWLVGTLPPAPSLICLASSERDTGHEKKADVTRNEAEATKRMSKGPCRQEGRSPES